MNVKRIANDGDKVQLYSRYANRNYVILALLFLLWFVFVSVRSYCCACASLCFVNGPMSTRPSWWCAFCHIIQSVSMMSFTTFSINGQNKTINVAINYFAHTHADTHTHHIVWLNNNNNKCISTVHFYFNRCTNPSPAILCINVALYTAHSELKNSMYRCHQ